MKITLISTFLLGIFFVSCSKKDDTPVVPPADKTTLTATVAAAQLLYDGTVEGTKPGQYEVGSKAAFKTVLDAANAVLADAAATQTAVTNANAQLVAAVATYQTHKINEIAAANLIGFWKMNGNTNDSSGNGNDGVATVGHAYFGAGVLAPAADRFGRAGMAYHFDNGANIDVPYKASLNPQQMSISLWVRQDTAGRTINPANCYMVAMNRWNGYKFQTQPSLPFFTVKAVTSAGDTVIYDRDDAGTALAVNTWRNLVVTFKSDTMKFYIDGDLVNTWDPSTPRPVPGNALTLADPIDLVIGQDLPTDKYVTVDDGTGRFFVNYGGFWKGDMDDVMFYNVALDGPQVHSIYVNQKDL